MAEFIDIDRWFGDKEGECYNFVTKALEDGELIAFPTDTVYGLGCDIENESAVGKIFELKKRSKQKALGAYLCGVNCDGRLEKMSSSIPEIFFKLSKEFLPGPLTMIIPRHGAFAALATSNSKGIAIRIPKHRPLLAFLSHYKGTLAGTSLNLAGEKPINDPIEIQEKFGSQIKYILTSNEKISQNSSTVIDLTHGKIKLLRKGDLDISTLKKFA